MDDDVLYTPFDAMRGTDLHYFADSPPSSPCSLVAVDSSPPDSPSIDALKLDDAVSDDDSSNDTTPNSSQTRKSKVEMSPAHPYSASTRAAKRPSLYGKDSERSRFKRTKTETDWERETLSDTTFRTLNFAPEEQAVSRHGGLSKHDAFPDIPVLGNAISINDGSTLRVPPVASYEPHISASAERAIWDDAIDKATMDEENIIDLTQKCLTYIPTNITDLNKRVMFDRKMSPIQTRALKREWSRSTSQAALGQNQDDISLILAGNRISRLPQELLSVESLTVLSLRGNKLEEIPPGICNLKNLSSLNVANNRLRYLPAEITRLHLQTLAVDPNPFLENPDAAKFKSKDRYVGPLERRYTILPLFELALRVLVAPAPTRHFLSINSSINSSTSRPKTVLEGLYDLPLSTVDTDGLSFAVRDALSACVPGSIGHTISPHVSPSQSHRRAPKVPPSVSTCLSQQHLFVGDSSRPPIFVDHAEERITWDKFVAGQRVGGDCGIPLRWRGCSPGCLDFLDEKPSAADVADSDGCQGGANDDWTMEVDSCSAVTAAPAAPTPISPPNASLPAQRSSEFGRFPADDIDLDD